MYKGDYDQEAIFLNKELDRKRIENEKCEAILYQADYEVLNSWNKDIRETRVVKFIHDNGTVYHGVYRGIDADKNAPNELDSISNPLTTDQFFASGDFWCAETNIPEELGQTPCEIWLGNRDIDGNIDWNNSVCLNAKALKGWRRITGYLFEDNANTEHYLTSPPPPLVDGVSIRINGLDDVTEREAKKYIDLVVQKVQESVRKNLSSISITKQEDGHIKLDYVLHHEPFERIRRITGYLVGSMDKWNNAKRAEEHERVKHIVGNRDDSGDPRVDEAIEKRFKQEQEYDKRFDELQEKEETYERCLEEKDFTHAYELHDSVSTENDALDFMKDVVRKHGTDTQILNDAVDAVTVLKGETPDFMAKLLQDTLKTDEYKKAFEAEQGKTQENTR